MKIESEFFSKKGDQAIWKLLHSHLDQRKALQRMILTSINADQKPQARTLILRELDSALKILYFFTDSRSDKVKQWQNNPYSEALAYCDESLLQIRLGGSIEVLEKGDIFDEALSKLKTHQYKDYNGVQPPGSPWRANNSDSNKELNFSVIRLKCNQIEVLEIKPEAEEHLRCTYSYNSSGKLVDTKRLVP